jgi:asparagine synthase (glutamine-hydrolysing)
VFNGEIYNYIELRNELSQLGHEFASTGDTEVILHAYEEWGTGCLTRFNGMFALAIYDPREKRLFLARDRFGVKPLLYFESETILLFASEPKALLGTGLVDSEIDEHSIIDYLKFGITDLRNQSFFRSIRQVPAGCFAVVVDGHLTISRWYELPRRALGKRPDADDLDYIAAFRTTLEDSVRLRMRSDVPVGMLLSGGLDSSSIVGVASHAFDPLSLEAHTVSFRGTSVDELDYAKSVASRCRVRLKVEDAETVDIGSMIGCVRAQQEPVISPSVVAQWLVMKAVHQSGIRVLLSGQGADEYLGGYAYFDSYAVRDFLARRQFRHAFRHLLSHRTARRIPEIVRGLIFLLAPAQIKVLGWKKQWLREDHHSSDACDYSRGLLGCKTLHDALYFHVTMRLPELLRYEDRNSMFFSIETRQPFLDYRLVELALNAAPETIVGMGVRKRLLRLALGDLIDPKVLKRNDKIGFQTPLEWLESEEFRAEYSRLIGQAPEPLRRLVDFDRARRLLAGRRSLRKSNDAWRIYNLLLWYSQAVSRAETVQSEPRVLASSNQVPANGNESFP